MTEQEINRVNWHLDVPVCRTLRGLKTHLNLITLDDLSLLCRYLHCDISQLVEKFWEVVKHRDNEETIPLLEGPSNAHGS